MKKTLYTFLLLIAIIFTLTACSDKKPKEESKDQPKQEQQEQQEQQEHIHNYGEWTTVKEASCTQKGTQERVCKCGGKESKDIEMIPHSFLDATCTAPKTCKNCSTTEGKALGHSANSSKCEDIVCSVCKETVKEQKHKFEVISAGKPSLVSSSQQIEQCVNCGEQKTVTLSPVEPQTLGMPII